MFLIRSKFAVLGYFVKENTVTNYDNDIESNLCAFLKKSSYR